MSFLNLQAPIVDNLMASGLQEDCPFRASSGGGDSKAEYLTAESVEEVDTEAFAEYAGRINQYLQACSLPLLCRRINEFLPVECRVLHSQRILPVNAGNLGERG